MKKTKREADWFMQYAPKKDEIALRQLSEGSAAPRIQSLRRAAIEKSERPRTLAEMVELLTPQKVADYLGCSLDHVYELVKAQELICQPDQSRKMIPVTALHDYLAAQQRKLYG